MEPLTLAMMLLGSIAASAAPAPSEQPVVSRPQPVDAFNTAVKAALSHRKVAQHRRAIVALDAALAAIRDQSGERFDKARSRARFYKALSLVELRSYDEAAALLSLLVASPGLSTSERTIVRQRLSTVTQLRRIELANRPGTISVQAVDADGKPLDGARVVIDGRDAPPPPFVVKLAPGRHRIELQHPQLRGERQVIMVKPGASMQLALRPRPPEPWSPPTGALATIGGALGIAAVGGVLHGLAALDYEAASDKVLPWVEANRLAQRGDKEALAAYALYGIAGAALVAAAIWMGVDGAAHGEPPAVSAGVSIGGGGGFAMAVGGSF